MGLWSGNGDLFDPDEVWNLPKGQWEALKDFQQKYDIFRYMFKISS